MDTRERVLEERAQRGDRDAWAQIWHRHHAELLATANAVLRNREDAEDAVVLGFTEAMLCCRAYELGDMGAWLRVAIRRRALNAKKAQSRLPSSLGDREPDWVFGAAPDDTATEVLRAEEVRAVGDAASRMRGHRGQALRLSLQGNSLQQVSDTLGLPFGTMRWHLSSARVAMKQALVAHGYGDA